ncbi:lasso peptide biosynthesis PqqD family chaperone [Streptomyces sp. P38-E01]|uniref:Lasso peptide biosynthesis PqqD family chaperone n=1 Tax=Streptomyces tardus TaxID=2780544 RepID=A0A949NAX2_9ACTN|nr:lasso peptide biosynthesis PqqD family chaperone [Streptomyces tardus]MBU7600288.1 lasso peptide biosynthesis PqqD family chaperone [Streptomyces tardus]
MNAVLPEHVVLSETDYGAVLLDQRRNTYFQLNPTAVLVLRTVLDGGSEEDAVRRVTETFPVAEERAAGDVAALLERMRAAEVLQA